MTLEINLQIFNLIYLYKYIYIIIYLYKFIRTNFYWFIEDIYLIQISKFLYSYLTKFLNIFFFIFAILISTNFLDLKSYMTFELFLKFKEFVKRKMEENEKLKLLIKKLIYCFE